MKTAMILRCLFDTYPPKPHRCQGNPENIPKSSWAFGLSMASLHDWGGLAYLGTSFAMPMMVRLLLWGSVVQVDR